MVIHCKNKWTEEDTKATEDLRSQGFTVAQIAKKIGKATATVQTRILMLGMTEIQKSEYRKRRWAKDKARPSYHESMKDAGRPPPEVLVDRVKRLATAKSTTQELMGDPPKGWSALDRKAG